MNEKIRTARKKLLKAAELVSDAQRILIKEGLGHESKRINHAQDALLDVAASLGKEEN